jgi:hypothetical protein
LLTAKRKHDLEVTAMLEIDRRLDHQSPNRLMSYFYGRPEGTAGEMFVSLQQWVETVVRNKINGTLEDL